MKSRVSAWTSPQIVGDLHEPTHPPKTAIALAHGAGGDRHSPLLIALCDAFAGLGWTALRLDLPYRQKRPKGPPSPSGAALDREGLLAAVESLRSMADRVYLGGSSYGGRQASMLAAERPEAADGLLLLSYPLHPPGEPEKLRTEHLPQVRIPTLFAHGSRDAFGTIEEMNAALALLAGPAKLLDFEGAAHGLVQKRHGSAQVAAVVDRIAREFVGFVSDR